MTKKHKIFAVGDTVFPSAILECRRLKLPDPPLLMVVGVRNGSQQNYITVTEVHKVGLAEPITVWIDSTAFIPSSEVPPCYLL